MSALYSDFATELAALSAKGNLRQLRNIEKREGNCAWVAGKKFLNLSSNDYLGLAADHQLQNDFFQQFSPQTRDHFCMTASSSRLLTGNHSLYPQLETHLADLFQRECCLIFNSGYHANLGILPAILGPKDIVLADHLCHASLIDGIRLSGAKLMRYHHVDYPHLASLLSKHRSIAKRAVIVTESVFSMDGDCADLMRLVELKKQYATLLYVDEAHAFGVMGATGLGLAEVQGVIPEIDFLVGTFGKALAGLGAYVIADPIIVNYLINKVRPFIFTTALPPVQLHWLHFLLQRMATFTARREHVLALGQQLRTALQTAQLAGSGNSQIIPIMIGKNADALQIAAQLQTAGYLLYAIRPPTVPEGKSRLRISLCANLVWQNLAALPDLIKSVKGTVCD